MVTILIHPFSYKILKHEGLPYYVSSSDPIYDYFFSSRDIKEIETLSIPITFYFKNNLVKDCSAGVGSSIFKYHKRMLFACMLSNLHHGVPASTSLKQFYEQYQITDDDYDSDNMYREWLRFYRPKSKPDAPAMSKLVRKITRSDIDEAMDLIITNHIDDFINDSGCFNIFLYRQIYYYLLKKYARMHILEIQRIHNQNKNTIWYHIRNAKSLINVRPDIQSSCLNALPI